MSRKTGALIDFKVNGFQGIQENLNPFANKNALLRSTNLQADSKPGILTNRPSYTLKYPTPVDTLGRLNSPTSISFDNFYEKTASNGVEVTIQVQTAQIKAPTGIANTYVFNGVCIWARPWWNGVYWSDEWKWLNEAIITKVTVAPDATYKNQIQIEGKYGNLAQWVLVNVTKDTTLPIAVLLSKEGVSDTTLYLSAFNNNIAINDTVILFRNYIPLVYQSQMYNVTKPEISFHRLPSKMRIGFGGKQNRIAIGIEYIKRSIQMSSYSFTAVAPDLVGNEFVFAETNSLVCRPYAIFNENNKDFLYEITNVGSGSLAAGTYHFRSTATMDGTDELMISEKSIDCASGSNKFSTKVRILAGSINRRLSEITQYFSNSGLDYYLWKTLKFSELGGNSIGAVKLDDDGYFYVAESNTNLYTEVSAVSPSDANSLGSWVTVNQLVESLSVVAGTAPDNYAIKNTFSSVLPYGMDFIIPITAINNPRIQVDVQYKVDVDFYANTPGLLYAGIVTYYVGSGSTPGAWNLKCYSPAVGSGTSNSSLTMYFTLTLEQYQSILNDLATYPFMKMGVIVYFGPGAPGAGSATMGKFSISPVIDPNIDSLPTGSEMATILGYTPTLNFVKDWQAAIVLKGSPFVGAGYIEKRYSTLIFFSPISGYGNQMYDILIAGKFLDSDKDSFRGESIVGLEQLLNGNIISLTENGGVIIDPTTGQTQEVARGYGLLTKDSLRNYRGTLYWASLEDFITASAESGYGAQVISAESVRGIYNLLTDKTLLSACIDKFGSYHVSISASGNYKELVFTARGWHDQDRDHHPVIFRNGFLGVVWFMDSLGNIYSVPTSLPSDVGYADIYGDYRSGW